MPPVCEMQIILERHQIDNIFRHPCSHSSLIHQYSNIWDLKCIKTWKTKGLHIASQTTLIWSCDLWWNTKETPTSHTCFNSRSIRPFLVLAWCHCDMSELQSEWLFWVIKKIMLQHVWFLSGKEEKLMLSQGLHKQRAIINNAI